MPEYPETIALEPLVNPPQATISVPGSKSITNRAMIMAALAQGKSRLIGALNSDDTQVMAAALRQLGFDVVEDTVRRTIDVTGRGGEIPTQTADMNLNNSGTSVRFLTALVALGNGAYRLDGIERMRERPQQELLDGLSGLGVRAEAVYNNGCPPLLVSAPGGLHGGTIKMNPAASSQFVTAILMVAPYAQTDVRIEIDGALRPFYIDITCRMMEQWGAFVGTGESSDTAERRQYHVPCQQIYAAQESYQIEPDASSASYLFGAAAITGGTITIPGLSADSLQGDVRFALEVLPEMGCTTLSDSRGITVKGPAGGKLHGVDRDMSAISDTSLTLAAIAPFASSPTTIRNIAHARKQECDRISAACSELKKMGVMVEEREDGMTIYPASEIKPSSISTYNDHRVAMSFALVGLVHPGIVIENPACVSKTFPTYWETLQLLR